MNVTGAADIRGAEKVRTTPWADDSLSGNMRDAEEGIARGAGWKILETAATDDAGDDCVTVCTDEAGTKNGWAEEATNVTTDWTEEEAGRGPNEATEEERDEETEDETNEETEDETELEREDDGTDDDTELERDELTLEMKICSNFARRTRPMKTECSNFARMKSGRRRRATNCLRM